MANNGWIKLHRKICDNWIWEDPEKLRAWIDILLMVNHEDKEIPFNGSVITIRKGEKLTSIEQLADRWHWNRKRVMRFLASLEASNMCLTKRTPNGTTLSVVKWDFYQLDGTTKGTPKGTGNGTPKGTTVGTQTRMIKNDKEYNNARARESSLSKRGVEREEDLDALLINEIINRKTDQKNENGGQAVL